MESRFGDFGVSYRKRTEFRGMPENVLISGSIFLQFSGSLLGYLGPRWLQGSTLDRFGRCQSITFHRFRIEICCIHEISSLSLYCTGNIIFFVIFTHSIHKFLHLSLIPPLKNHTARRSVRSTPGDNITMDLGGTIGHTEHKPRLSYLAFCARIEARRP